MSCGRWRLGFGVGLRLGFEKDEDGGILGLMEVYADGVKILKLSWFVLSNEGVLRSFGFAFRSYSGLDNF